MGVSRARHINQINEGDGLPNNEQQHQPLQE
jgi:hypothetical protein